MDFVAILVGVALGLMIWDCVEVGRNDAANLVNAVFGSRILRRQTAVYIAGVAVVLGATFASPVMETARSGIFDPGLLTIQTAIIVYVSVYIVDTVLLYTYSAFGMPVSTTACLVFELVGASVAVAACAEIVHWDKVGKVIVAIGVSIAFSGIAGFLIQRAFRGAIREKCDDHVRVLLHGPWVGGLMLVWLVWFILLKGLQDVAFIRAIKAATLDVYGEPVFLAVGWGAATLLVHLALVATREWGTRNLFRVTAVIGMLCMAFAFGQNDLANCASPGLSSLWLWMHSHETTEVASSIPIPTWLLFGCGLLMVVGMGTRNAQRVTRAAVNTGSQQGHVALYAPMWCRAIARRLIRPSGLSEEEAHLTPPPSVDEGGKKMHYDPLRASVIMSVSASVIAFASGHGFPVSTTYVAFAAVVATGLADRAIERGDADLKMGRAIWVVFSWFASALIAMAASGAVALAIMKLGMGGLVLGLVANLVVRYFAGRRSDAHERVYHGGAGGAPQDMA